MARAPLAVLLALAACGPVPLEQAERICAPRAYAARAPQGSISIGINSDGKVGVGTEIGVSTDYIAGRDPADVYDACVMQQSGRAPSRAYTAYPNSR